MKRWWLIIALLLSLGINVGFLAKRALRSKLTADPVAVIDPEVERQARELPPIFRRLAADLRLRGETRKQFFELQRAFLDQTVEGRQEVSQLQTELRRELISADPDRELIDQTLETLAAAHFRLEKIFVDNLLDTRKLLGPHQERIFMRFMQRVRQSRSESRQWLRERRQRAKQDRSRGDE